jgi:hypothetical protein
MMDGSNHMRLRLGEPREIRKYIKIDAEGFEQKVISTLHHAVPIVSMEFNFPQMENALLACVQHLSGIGNYRFNAAISEPPFALEFDPWLRAGELVSTIRARKWGYSEVYARVDP